MKKKVCQSLIAITNKVLQSNEDIAYGLSGWNYTSKLRLLNQSLQIFAIWFLEDHRVSQVGARPTWK